MNGVMFWAVPIWGMSSYIRGHLLDLSALLGLLEGCVVVDLIGPVGGL